MIRAARQHEARVAAGHDDEPSDEARAGELLEAELAVDLHDIAQIARAWAEANR